jgi:hypothetical protein
VSIPKFANCVGPRGCGVSFKTAGSRNGHCSGCHRTFVGLRAFDRHQTITDGKVTCHDPTGMRAEDDPDRELYASREDGGVTYWSLALSAEAAERLASTRPERRGLTQITDVDTGDDHSDSPDDDEEAA